MKRGCTKSITTEEFNWCEHCSGADGMVGRFICIDDGVNWCLYCAFANSYITERELKKLEAEERLLYINWLKAELQRLKA